MSQIQEFNAQDEPSNPVVFTYNTTPITTDRIVKDYTNTLNFSETDLAGDFDGDGRLDFVANNKLFTNLFKADTGNAGINLPFNMDKRQIITATTLSKVTNGYTLNQRNTIVFAEESANTIYFKTYDYSTATQSFNLVDTRFTPADNNIYYDSSLDIVIPNNPILNSDVMIEPCETPALKKSTEYLEGDFNGDGISEVLILSKINERYYYEKKLMYYDGSSRNYLCTIHYKSDGIKAFLLNLDPNLAYNPYSPNNPAPDLEPGFIYLGNNISILEGDKKYVMDFNGDGKSDILILSEDKTYKIYTFKQLLQDPWVQLEILGEGILPDYSKDKQIIFGDYNGDGKTDIMIPVARDSADWAIYYSNPKPAGGAFFERIIRVITNGSGNTVAYDPDGSGNTYSYANTYYGMDIDKDGKTDLVRFYRMYYKPDSDWWDPTSWTINDHDTDWRVSAFTNIIGNSTNTISFKETYVSPEFTSGSPDLPFAVTSNYRYQGSNTDLVIVRGHYHQIEFYQFKKDFDTDNRLASVTESSGNIKHTIDYKPMLATNNDLGDASTDFYSSTNTALYPDIEIIRNPSSYLVSKLTATINGVSKFQDFKYRGYISNFNYGTVGFKRTARSSWYLQDSDTKIWTTQNSNPALRGATDITWTSTNKATVFASTPSDLLNTKTNVFATYTNLVSKVYNVQLTSQASLDALTGIMTVTTNTYDTTVDAVAALGLQTKSSTSYYNSTILQGINTTSTFYDNNPTGIGNAYYIGRPNKITTKNDLYFGTATGSILIDTRTSEEKYTYTGNNLTRTEKKGHNTDYIQEDMTYDTVGNLLTKKMSVPSSRDNNGTRTIIDEYDPVTKRFVIKKTDHQGFVTTLEYNTIGQVKKSTNYLGVISEFTFDNWGKLLQTTITGASLTPLVTTISYFKLPDGGYTATSQNIIGDNAKSITQYDVLGRVVKSATKGFAANSLISKSVVYDALGRKLKESEPYFSAPSKWTEYQYDYLHRPIQVTAPTGRIQILSYLGLTTKSVDDGKTTTATLDAMGNKIQTTDPGGTVNFTYYANGQLKESNFEEHKVSIGIDGWGNKVSMTDPNAGTYTYEYDAFGQSKKETTPKGYTAYTYDNLGKLTHKKILGDGADYEIDYTYNALAQLTAEVSKNAAGNNIDNYSYVFDSFHRLSSTTETNGSFTHTKTITYDTYGRLATENNDTQDLNSGFSSSVLSKSNYNGYNGIMDKLTDANNLVLWQLNTANEKMQSLTETLGNGVAITNVYDSNNYFASQKHSKNSIDILYNTYAFNGIKGTLSNRQNVALGTSESFTYDNLDRLTQWTNPLTNTFDTNTYDNKGRITTNNKIGDVNYNSDTVTGIYRKSSISLNTEGNAYYQNLPKQTVTYTMFKAPMTINESSKGGTSFNYNSHLSRMTMDYNYVLVVTGNKTKPVYTKKKSYTDDGSTEILYDQGALFYDPNADNSTIKIITYVGGDAYTAPLYIEKTRVKATGIITEKKYYLHRDYLGSIIAISDENGVGVERRQFDAWGNLSKLQQNGVNKVLPTDGTSAGLMMLDRGYTSHEHLAEVGLIQMNGRLYDPVLRSFIMPDNFIQQPDNTQNYNRYAYCLNNPLKYTDPSGELFGIDDFAAALIIGAIISAATYTLTALLADVPFSLGGLAQSTFIGAASAAVTFGIGDAASSFTNFYSRASFQAVAHGFFQGEMGAISGGKFWSGFAAGALSSIAASAWSGGSTENGFFKENDWAYGSRINGPAGLGFGGDIGMVAFGTVSGGAGAALSGGNFWQGAATGLVVSGLNHAMHEMDDDNGYDKNGKQINNKGGDTTDYRYDDDGNITSSTSVMFKPSSQWNFANDNFRSYGVKYSMTDRMATGAIAEDNSIFEMYAGGKIFGLGLSYLGEGFNAIKTPLFKSIGNGIKEYFPKLGANRYLRIGLSHSRGREVFRITWGGNLKHLLDIDLGKIPKIK